MDVRVLVALGLVESKGLWLVGKRGPGRVFTGLWEFPGGKMEPGETESQAAVREVLEETGLAVAPAEILGCIETAHEGRTVLLHLVRCRPLGGDRNDSAVPTPRPASPAVTELRWVSLDELQALPMPPANAEIVRLLRSRFG